MGNIQALAGPPEAQVNGLCGQTQRRAGRPWSSLGRLLGGGGLGEGQPDARHTWRRLNSREDTGHRAWARPEGVLDLE